jgi:CheY-like chemotaxis protein
MHVLVCDDDASTRFTVSGLLRKHFDCTISEAANGLEALELIERERFDFLLLDLQMPVLSGIEAIEQLRSSPTTHALPIVVLSHVRDEAAVTHVLKLGVSDYILKPLRTEHVVTKIQRLVKTLPQAPPSHSASCS